MNFTTHARVRMGQRGIPDRIVQLVSEHGHIVGDRRILDRRGAKKLLYDLDRHRQDVMRVIDKGGVAIVEDGDRVITAFNLTKRAHR